MALTSTSHTLEILITHSKRFGGLILEPIRLSDVKPGFLRNRHSSIKVRSTFELLKKPRIVFEFGKQGCELFLGHSLMADNAHVIAQDAAAVICRTDMP